MIHPRRIRTTSALALLLVAAGCGGIAVVERDRGDDGQGGEASTSGGSTGSGWENLGCGDIYAQIASDPSSHAMVCFNGSGEDCPSIYNATPHIAPSRPCSYIVSIDCGPQTIGPSCCYLVTEEAASCQ